jgi:hypothetical protein
VTVRPPPGRGLPLPRRALIALAAVHLLLAFAVSARGTGWLIRRNLTLLPASFSAPAQVVENVSAGVSGQLLPRSNPIRQGINTYLHLAGIQAGYGYFAPNVPDASKLVFELHRSNGEVAYETAGLERGESGLRFASFLDFLGRTASDRDRRFLIELLARPVWRAQPDVVRMRAIVATVAIAPPDEFRRTKAASYDIRAVYEIERPPSSD